MKKLFAAILLLALIAPATFSKSLGLGGLGIHSNGNASSDAKTNSESTMGNQLGVRLVYDYGFDYESGFTMGVFDHIRFGSFFTQPEIALSFHAGEEEEYSYSYYGSENSDSLTYFDMNCLIGFDIGSKKNFLSIYGGYSIGFGREFSSAPIAGLSTFFGPVYIDLRTRFELSTELRNFFSVSAGAGALFKLK